MGTSTRMPDGWRVDESSQEVLREVRGNAQRRCSWGAFTEEEFGEVLRCTAPRKACGVDSIYSFPIRKCPRIRKAVHQLVKKMVEWKFTENWDEKKNWLVEGKDSVYLQGRRQEKPSELPPYNLSPNHHEDGHARNPQVDEKMVVWENRKEFAGI